MKTKSHYDYLEEHFSQFANNLGIGYNVMGLIYAHGDKFYYYRDRIEEAGMEFWQGVAIGLLTYCKPWCNEVRETEKGWIDVGDWIINNKDRFLDKF